MSRERFGELQRQSEAWEARFDTERRTTASLMLDIVDMKKAGFQVTSPVPFDPSIPLTVDEADAQAAARMELQS